MQQFIEICLPVPTCLLAVLHVHFLLQALDQVIAEANQQGIRLLLCLVNNLQAYGGKSRYVEWAIQQGVGLSSSNDSFFYDPSIRQYYKNYVRVTIHISFVHCNLPFDNLKHIEGVRSDMHCSINSQHMSLFFRRS